MCEGAACVWISGFGPCVLFTPAPLPPEAVKAGQVLVDGAPARPAHEVRPQEVVTILARQRERMLRVLAAPRSRVGAKLVPLYAEPVEPLPG